MSNTKRLLALAVLPTLLLAGCGGDDSKASKSSSSSTSKASTSSSSSTLAKAVTNGKLSDVKVDTKKHTVTIDKSKRPFGTKNVDIKTLKAGSGKTASGNDVISLDVIFVNGTSGKQLMSTYGQGGARVDLGDASQQMPGLLTALKQAKTGSQMLVSIPAKEAFGPNGVSDAGVGGNDDILAYLDIHNVAQTSKPAADMPQPSTKNGETTFTFPKGVKAPTSLKQTTLVHGNGAQVKKGQTIYVTYTGQVWGGQVFDSTAKQGGSPANFKIGVGNVIKGWDTALVGKKVGDRVLVVVPPADGYGKSGNAQAGIKGTDTIVFLVDILAAQ